MSCLLYDTLLESISKKQLKEFTVKEIVKICEQINLFNRRALDLTYVIIKIFFLREKKNEPNIVPIIEDDLFKTEKSSVNGECQYSDITFSFQKFPLCLQHMLSIFSDMNKDESEIKTGTTSEVKNFMKRIITPTFVLKGIDVSSLDKLYSMKKIYIDTCVITDHVNDLYKWPTDIVNNHTTNIDMIGIYNVIIHESPTVLLRSKKDICKNKDRCGYCGLVIPDEWTPINYEKTEIFCSFNCIRTKYNENNKSINKIYDYYKKINIGPLKVINQSPPYILLEEYGGYLSSKEYQAYIYKNSVFNKIYQSIYK
jgi:hypothetical protein